MNNRSSFLVELKRRNVYKVAAAYAVIGWLVVQVATQVFPFFEIPNWVVRLVVLAIAIGFPISRASDSSHLWSQTYDRALTDVFKVQDEIAGDVVAALNVKLLPTQELPKVPRTSNPEAYQQYLQGRYYLSRFSIADLEKARAFFEQ